MTKENQIEKQMDDEHVTEKVALVFHRVPHYNLPSLPPAQKNAKLEFKNVKHIRK